MYHSYPDINFVRYNSADELQELYGKEVFQEYLEDNKFDLQSKKLHAHGREVRYSYRQFANIWGSIFLGLVHDPSINLGQLIRNYHDPRTNQVLRDSIVRSIFQTLMINYYDGKEENHEVIMLGLGMIFQDELDWSNTRSIVHITGERVDVLFSEALAE